MILPQPMNQTTSTPGEAGNPTVAVLGCGYWGQNLVRHFQHLGALRAVGDASEKGRSRARELAPETILFEDFHQVLRDPRIEAVVIATPADTHFSIVKEAIENGKHVLCEKPLALHYRQAVQLERMAAAANCT